MELKSGLENMFLKFLHAQAISILIERKSFDQKYKLRNKNDMACAWRSFKKNCGMSSYGK